MQNLSEEIQHRKTIVVNSTAAVNGGAVTIINEFITAILSQNIGNEYNFVFFTAVDFEINNLSNIKIFNLGKKNYIQRIQWDYFGLNRFLNKNNLYPDLIMSFQNTGVVYKSACPQLIYYHNPFCLLPYPWNPFKKSERTLWFYTKIYPIFIKALINQNTRFIVQGNWIKKAFSKKFKVKQEKIDAIAPTVKPFSIEYKSIIDQDQYNLFFPATGFLYKNHKLLLNMLSSLRNINLEFFKKVQLILTLSEEDISSLNLQKEYNDLKENIILTGYISKTDILQRYLEANVVVFPSMIETFGLPLVEAASLNKFIICADEQYAHETLTGYSEVEFLDSKNEVLWAEKCIQVSLIKKENNKILPIESRNKDSWSQIFDLIKKIIYKDV